MSNEIKNNLVYLVENIRNLEKILLYLQQYSIISDNEKEEILSEKTPERRNESLLKIIQRQDWEKIGNIFLHILNETKNGLCAEKISENSLPPQFNDHTKDSYSPGGSQLSKLFDDKWWPERKEKIRSYYERKTDDELLVAKLYRLLQENENKTTVITQDKLVVSGLGGIGKTSIAISLAHHYEGKYEHILWLDCGEGRLESSFKSLATKLEIKNRAELTLGDIARESFSKLSRSKCLLIFDNAECFIGDQGIRNFLPKHKNLHSIITSRSQDWGKSTGYGKITTFSLNVFSKGESLEFMKKSLQFSNYLDFQLENIGHLLGHLPLALQIAVATLNIQQITVTDYICGLKRCDDILYENFDDYELTINKTMKISLDQIKKLENGDKAYRILTVFGYIQPHEVEIAFFQNISNSELLEMKNAVAILQKYSLVTLGSNLNHLSIHRLLQQVIRLNGKDIEKDILRNIFSCAGFLTYKIIPFTKFADELLQKEFPTLKAQLLDQKQLKSMFEEKLYEECVQLARFIHQEVKINTSLFNYAICLERNRELKESGEHLEKLYNTNGLVEKYRHQSMMKISSDILELSAGVSKDLAAYHLMINFWKNGNRRKACEILKERKHFQSVSSTELLCFYLQILSEDFIKSAYTLKYTSSFIEFNFEGASMSKIEFKNCFLDMKTPLPLRLHELKLEDILNDENIYFREWIPKTLKILTIRTTRCILYLSSLSSIQKLILHNCSLDLDCDTQISPTELTLNDISFFHNGEEFQEVVINSFVHFQSINEMQLSFLYRKINILLVLTEDIVNIDYLSLHFIKVSNWKTTNWNCNQLSLYGVPFVKSTNMCVRDIEISNSPLDFFCLPQTVQKLFIDDIQVDRSQPNEFPSLKYLKLNGDSCCLSNFRNAQITQVHFHFTKEIILTWLPQSVQQIKITNDSPPNIVGGTREVGKLIFQRLSFYSVVQVTKYLQPKLLIVYWNSINANEETNEYNCLSELMEKIEKIVISILLMNDQFQKSSLAHKFDRISDYYIFECGKVRAINSEMFEKFVEFG